MRRGFTLIELLVAVILLSIIAAVLIPSAMEQNSVTADTTARILSSDLEHAQMLAVSRPDRRVALVIDADGLGWRIVDADSPLIPLVDSFDDRHQGRTLAVRCGIGRASVCDGATITPAGEQIVFDPLGGLETPGGVHRSLSVAVGESARLVMVDPDTGFISLE
ncbi:MAG: type II secretion system protein [Phycisphaerales bacterium]|jgi:prepilin-type N-terminal cleavage/methylation domain-containing protein|nr:type II secretion system protein [Phycisphaerales bacterium]